MTLIENPLVPAFVGLVFSLCCFSLWFVFRHWLPLVVGGIAFLLAVGVVGLSIWIDSPREQVERTVNQLAMAAQNNDTAKLLQFVSTSAEATRREAEREMDATKFVSCWIAKIHKIEIEESQTPPTARVSLAMIATVEESRYGAGRGRVQLWLDLVKEPDGQWRVASYKYSVE